MSRALHVLIRSGQPVLSVVNQMSAISEVEYARPSDIYEPTDHLTEPDDPSYSSQWALNNRGNNAAVPVGRIDADIDAPQAWEHKTDCRRRIVAVLDTGADLTHPDLAANLWANPGEIAGDGIDNDVNGFVDDVSGADWVYQDGDPTDDEVALAGHGTKMAGVIGAVGNNGVDIAGICWQAQLMIVKVLPGPVAPPPAGAGWPPVENGMAYAIANSTRILNLSLGAFMAATVHTQRGRG